MRGQQQTDLSDNFFERLKSETKDTVNSNLAPIFNNKVLAENEEIINVSNIPDFKHAS